MEGKGRSEDNTEDFMEDGGRLRRILVRMEDIDLIQKIFITGTLWSVTFVIEFNWHIWLCDVLTPSYGIFNITYVLTFKSTSSVVSCKISAAARRHLGYTSWSWTFFKYLLCLVHSFLVQWLDHQLLVWFGPFFGRHEDKFAEDLLWQICKKEGKSCWVRQCRGGAAAAACVRRDKDVEFEYFPQNDDKIVWH